MIDRVDSFFDIPAIQAEFAAIKTGLAESQTNLVGLYSVIKSFKDTSLSNLAQNTENLSSAIVGTVQATTKAKTAYDELTQRIAAQVKTVNESITSVNQNTAAYDKLIQQAVRNKIANDDLAASASALKKSYDSGQSTLEQYTASLADVKTAQQTLKVSNQDITKSLNSLEKQAQSSSGSLDQLRSRLNELQQSYDKLSEAERETEGGQSLLKTIQTTDQAVKSLEGTTGRFKSNVGNYSGALKPLEEELQRVNEQLAQMDKLKGSGLQNMNPIGFKTASQKQSEGLTDQMHGGPTNLAGGIGFDPARYKELSTQAKALNLVLSQQEKGFTSVNQAIRTSERALATLESVGLEGSEGFDKFRESTVSAAQAQKEFLRQEKLLESEAPLLGALTLAVKGLAGAYAIGAGAVSFFAEGNEKVEKELNKLIAIMTILQGLDEAYRFIQQSGAISASIKLAFIKATTIATAESIAATEAATAANIKATLAAEAAAAASGEEAIALQAEAAAAEEAAIATTAAAVSAEAMNTALVSTGIGAAIAVIALAISELVTKLHEWQLGTGLTIKEQEALAEATQKVNEAIIEQVKLADEQDQALKKSYENQLSLSQAAGENEYRQTAIRKALIQEEKNLAQARIEGLRASYSSVKNLDTQISKLERNIKTAAEIEKAFSSVHPKDQTLLDEYINPAQAAFNRTREQQIKAAQDNQVFYKKQVDSIKAIRDAQKSALDDRASARQKESEDELKIQKFSTDEQQKLTFETVTLQVEAIKDRNSRILALDTSSRAQRLAAIRSDADADIKLAQTQFAIDKEKFKAGQITDIEYLIAQKELKAKIFKADQDANNQQADERKRFRDQDRASELAAYKTQLEDRIKADQDIQQGKNQNNPNPLIEKPKAGLSERLAALADEYAARRDLAEAERKNELANERLDGTESLSVIEDKQAKIKEINEKYGSQIIQLNKDLQKTYLELEEEARQRSLQDWNKYYTKRKEQITENQNQELISLNISSERGQQYTRDKQKIDDNAAIAQAQADAQNAEIQRNATKEGTQQRIDADKKLTDSAVKLSETIRQKKDDSINSTRQQAEEGMQEVQMVGNAIISLSSIAYNVQEQHLKDLEIMQQRSYDRQAKNIQDSTASQEQMAVRMKILDDQRAQQKLLNDRKQRQLDIQKAEFDKASAIMNIILNTAKSVTAALDNPILAVAIGIAGAAELALAIATPIPKYREGTKDHPGGPAVVGDAYEHELILEPGKEARWSSDRPTVESLMKHTKVIPRAQIEKMAMSGMFVNQQGILIQGQSDNKKELRDLKDAIIWQTQRLEGAASKNNRKVIIVNKIDHSWGDYIQSKVFK